MKMRVQVVEGDEDGGGGGGGDEESGSVCMIVTDSLVDGGVLMKRVELSSRRKSKRNRELVDGEW